MARPKWQLRLRKILLWLMISIVVLASAELVLWVIGGFYYQPINRELGRLDNQYGNTFRILCIGDSHTFGMDAPPDMSYPAQLERLLSTTRSDTRYVVVNQGVPGYNSSQALSRLRKILEGPHPTPQLVMVGVGKNNNHNFRKARFWEADKMADAPVRHQAAYLLEHSKVFQLGKVTEANLKAGLANKLDLKERQILSPKDAVLLAKWLEADYKEMVDLVKGKGSRIAFINYFHPIDFIDSSMQKVSANRGVPMIDVRWDMLPFALMYGLIGKTMHPNQRGYSRIAQSVFDGLMNNGLIPDSQKYIPITIPDQEEPSTQTPGP